MRRLSAAVTVATLMLLMLASGSLAGSLGVAGPAAAAPPNFTLSAASSDVRVVQGSSTTVSIAIGRVAGSAGDILLAVSGLPAGVHGQFAPNPATATASTLTLSADPTAPPLSGGDVPVTVTGTPQNAKTGAVSHSVTIDVGVLPAFTVAVAGSTSVSLASCTVAVPVVVGRTVGFGGPVSVSVTGLPSGVQATFAPVAATFPGGMSQQTVTLTLTASRTGNTILSHTATIHATAPPFLEQTATFTVAGTCPLQYDPEVVSMQITQGTQLLILPQRNPTNPGAAITYASIGQAATAGTQQALAELAAFKPTVVRVYADLRYGPESGIQVPAVLKGFSYDRSGNLVALPGSPILPTGTPGSLAPGLLGQFGADFVQDSYTGVYTFTLPSSWERGKIELEVDLSPAESGPLPPVNAPPSALAASLPGLPPTWAPCTTSACQVDNRFAISEIPFQYTFPVTIRPLAMIVTNPYDATLPDPVSVFRWAGVVTPIPLIVEPYSGTIDIGDQVGKDNTSGAVTIALLNRVLNYVCHRGSPAHGWDVGIEHNDIRSAKDTGYCWQGFPIPARNYYDFAVVNAPEPLVSVSHELFHLLGRPHASAGCGAAVGLGGTGTQPAESWPTDQRGFLQSVGLAPAPPGYRFPYQVIPTSSSTPSGQWYDFMSYCDNIADGNPLGPMQDAWVSVHNWNAILGTFGYSADASPRAIARARAAASPAASRPVVSTAHAAASAVASLQVTASVDRDGHVTILDVSPVKASAQPASSSPYHLIATGSASHTNADVPMLASFGHIDSRPVQPILTLTAVVPAAGVTSVGVLSNGVMLATRHKSPHSPTVTISRLPSFHASTALIRWRAADSNHTALTVEIDYSGNGGRTWTTVWMGPNPGSALLPSRYLFASSNARIRVLVNDGFQTSTAVSRRFRSPGAPPSVQILLPWTGLRQSNDAPLVLNGQAFDDQSRLLTGRHLRWMLGRRLLGTGAQITVSGLPAGIRRIELIARDRSGRVSVASIVVRLRAAQPLFLTLQAPRTLGPKSRSLRLTVSSSLDATLLVRLPGPRAQRFAVGRRTRRLTVKVIRGSTPLNLRLALAAGGMTRTAQIAVAR